MHLSSQHAAILVCDTLAITAARGATVAMRGSFANWQLLQVSYGPQHGKVGNEARQAAP